MTIATRACVPSYGMRDERRHRKKRVLAVLHVLEVRRMDLAVAVHQEDPAREQAVGELPVLFDFGFEVAVVAGNDPLCVTRRAIHGLAMQGVVLVFRSYRMTFLTSGVRGASIENRLVAAAVTMHFTQGVAIHAFHSCRPMDVGVVAPFGGNQTVAAKALVLGDRITSCCVAVLAQGTMTTTAVELVIRDRGELLETAVRGGIPGDHPTPGSVQAGWKGRVR